MTEVEELAGFVPRARFEDFSAAAQEQLKIRVLDAIGCKPAPPPAGSSPQQ
jgi:2-methylcitrate dehydratase